MDRSRSAGRYLAESLDLLRANWWRAALAFVVATSANSLLDRSPLLGDSWRSAVMAFSLSLLVDLVLEFELTFALLRRSKAISGPTDWRRFGSMLVLGLITTAAIWGPVLIFDLITAAPSWLGMPLLLVPAFYLSTRWIVTAPVLIGDRTGFIEAFRRSWNETSDIFWPVFSALAVTVFLPTVAALIATLYWSEAGTGLGPDMALNALGSASTVLSWHLAVAIYLHRRPRPQLTEVFA